MTRWSFESEPPPDELVTIRVFEKQEEYMVARSLLESAEIECFWQGEHGHFIDPSMNKGAGVSGVALQVRKSDAEDALAILDAPPLDENYVVED